MRIHSFIHSFIHSLLETKKKHSLFKCTQQASLFDARPTEQTNDSTRAMGGDDDEWRARVNRDDAVQQLCVRD
jgi:hypothetical protein